MRCYNRGVFGLIFNLGVAVAMLTVTASPLFEIFDKWDNIPATGSDTGVTLIAILACICFCYCMTAVIDRLIGIVFSLLMLVATEESRHPRSNPQALEYELLLYSPPLILASLRI